MRCSVAEPHSLSRLVGLASKQANELVHADTDLTEDSSQGASIEFTMPWHHGLGKRFVSSHDDVAPMLTANPEAYPLQGRHNLLP